MVLSWWELAVQELKISNNIFSSFAVTSVFKSEGLCDYRLLKWAEADSEISLNWRVKLNLYSDESEPFSEKIHDADTPEGVCADQNAINQQQTNYDFKKGS